MSNFTFVENCCLFFSKFPHCLHALSTFNIIKFKKKKTLLSSSFLQDGLQKSTPEPVGHHHCSLLITIYKFKKNKFNEIFKYFFHTSWPWRLDARSCRTSSLMLFSGNEISSMFSFVCCSGFVRSLAGLLSFVKNNQNKTTTTTKKKLNLLVQYWPFSSFNHYHSLW